ncbi:1153_t:CDS:2, partial [Paraglomus occultum]
GFFIAVFEKTGPITDVTTKSDDKYIENEEETLSLSREPSAPEDMSAAPEEIENDDYEAFEIGESDLISSTDITDSNDPADITDSNDPAEIPDVEGEALPQKRVNADSSDVHNKRLKVDTILTSRQSEKSTSQNDGKGQKRGKSGISYEEQFIFLESDNEDLSVIKSLLTSPDASRLRVINTGLRVFTKQDVPEEVKCSYRLHSEGVAVIAPWMEGEKRVVRGEMEDLVVLLSEQTPRFEKFRDEMKEKLLAIAPLQASTSTVPLPPIILPIWRGRSSLNLLYKKEERHALELRIQNYMGKPIGSKDKKKVHDQNSSTECKELERNNTADEQVKKDIVEP